MSDYFEIDFLDVESDKSGDAIAIRYSINDKNYIHVVDGGFQATGDSLIAHINNHYGTPSFIDHVVLTHNDNDHAGGLRKVLENYDVGTLWMLRPWLYLDELIERFSTYTSIENLAKKLKEVYPNIAALEEIAINRGITIREPFQGVNIGNFHVLSPTKEIYLALVWDSPKTPDAKKQENTLGGLATISNANTEQIRSTLTTLFEPYDKGVGFVKALWGQENLSSEDTSAENEMSIVQYAILNNRKILLTGDVGKKGLETSYNYLISRGISLPRFNLFQVPHHGSRRNVSPELLNLLLGPKLSYKPSKGDELFTAVVSSAKKDEAHPRKAVIRAIIHRGGKLLTTEGKNVRYSYNAPNRNGWTTAIPSDYPEDQET